jgi:hypothetical protein
VFKGRDVACRQIEYGAKEKRRWKPSTFLALLISVQETEKVISWLGRKTEKSRFKRSILKIKDKMREIRYWPIKDQADKINQMLRGHYNY